MRSYLSASFRFHSSVSACPDTQLIAEGRNPESIRLMLGHSDGEMTRRYFHPKAEERKAFMGGVLGCVDGLYLQGENLNPSAPTNLSV